MTTTVLPNMGLELPERGAPGSGEWHDTLDANLGREDVHNHTAGKGVAVPTAGININADLSYGSLYAPINLHRITFASIVALTGNNKSLFVNTVDNELYWRSNAGTNVKLTSGNALNVAAFTGGIGGDYAATGALVDFDDATDTYRFRQETAAAVRQFAKVKFADIILTEYDPSGDASVPANSVTIKSPDALAGNYSVTMPAALPGSTQLVQMDNAGVLTASNTVANAVTLSGGIAGTTATAAITASGLITANAGVTAGANQNMTVSGTGGYKHGSVELGIHIAAFMVDGASTFVTFNQIGYITGFGGACTVQAWIPLPVGKRILTYRQFYNVNSTGVAITPKLRRMTIGTGAKTDVAAGAADSTGAAVESQNITGINHTVLTGEGYFIEVSVSNAAHQVFGASISYDEP